MTIGGRRHMKFLIALASLLASGQTSHKSGLLLEIYSHVNMSLVRSVARAILGRALV